MDLFEELCEQEGGRLGRDAMRTWLRSLWYSDRNIYRYATAEDFAYLSRRWPDEHSFDPEVDRVTMGRIMERLEGVRPDADWRVVANLQKGIALMLLDRSLMHAEASTPPARRHRSHLRRAVRPEGLSRRRSPAWCGRASERQPRARQAEGGRAEALDEGGGETCWGCGSPRAPRRWRPLSRLPASRRAPSSTRHWRRYAMGDSP